MGILEASMDVGVEASVEIEEVFTETVEYYVEMKVLEVEVEAGVEVSVGASAEASKKLYSLTLPSTNFPSFYFAPCTFTGFH